MQVTHSSQHSHYSAELLRRVRRQVGGNIWRIRQRRRMTLKKLSQLSGVPEWRIDQYELGKNEVGLEDLLRLCCALQSEMKTILY